MTSPATWVLLVTFWHSGVYVDTVSDSYPSRPACVAARNSLRDLFPAFGLDHSGVYVGYRDGGENAIRAMCVHIPDMRRAP